MSLTSSRPCPGRHRVRRSRRTGAVGRVAVFYRGRARCPHRAAILIQRNSRLNVIMSHPSTAPSTAFQGHPNANAAAPKSNGNSASELGRASHSLLGAGEMRPRRRRRVARGEAEPRSGRKRPRGIGESFGKAIHPKRRGEQPTEGIRPKAAGLGSFSRALGNRENPPEENGTPHPPRNPTQTRGLLTHSATASSTTSHCVGRVARGLASKGDSPPDPPTVIHCPFAANPVVASASTIGCKLSYRQRARLRPSV